MKRMKIKIKPLIVVLLVTFFMIIFSARTASCFYLLDDKLEVSGFIENWSAFRLENGHDDLHDGLKAGDYSLCHNTIQVEFEYKMTEELSLKGIWRAWYEGSLDFNKRMDNLINPHRRDEYTHENDMREIYVNFTPGNWRLRAGKQQIVWGESDGFRMADIINPLDFSWHYFFPSWEDIRIPLWSADIRYAFPCNIGPFGNSFVEFVFIPNAFDGGYHPTKLAPAGANWSFPGYPQIFLDWIRNATPEPSLRASEEGMRVRGVVDGWDLSLFSFYTYTALPVINIKKFNFVDNPFEFKRTMMVGGTFNKYNDFTQTVFRGECVARINEPYNTVDLTKILRKESFAYMLGFDRPTWIRPLSDRHPFFISGQVFQKFVFNWDESIGTADMSNDGYQTLITLLVNNSFTWPFLTGTDNVTPQVFGMWDPSGEGWVQPSLSFMVGNYWRGSIGYNWITARQSDEAYFGQVLDNSEVYFNIRFQW